MHQSSWSETDTYSDDEHSLPDLLPTQHNTENEGHQPKYSHDSPQMPQHSPTNSMFGISLADRICSKNKQQNSPTDSPDLKDEAACIVVHSPRNRSCDNEHKLMAREQSVLHNSASTVQRTLHTISDSSESDSDSGESQTLTAFTSSYISKNTKQTAESRHTTLTNFQRQQHQQGEIPFHRNNSKCDDDSSQCEQPDLEYRLGLSSPAQHAVQSRFTSTEGSCVPSLVRKERTYKHGSTSLGKKLEAEVKRSFYTSMNVWIYFTYTLPCFFIGYQLIRCEHHHGAFGHISNTDGHLVC